MKHLSLVSLLTFFFSSIIHPQTFNIPQNLSHSYGASDFQTIDFDGDFDFDIVASSSDGAIYWFENLGNGSFSNKNVLINAGLTNIHLVDVNGDGEVDILGRKYTNSHNYVVWFENLGNGFFSNYNIISSSSIDAIYLVAEDLNGDGNIDVIAGSSYQIGWYENLGNGSFSSYNIFDQINGVSGLKDIEPTDVDGDGDIDVLSVSEYDNKISLYENLGNGSFSGQQIISNNINDPNRIYSEDIDNDGMVDFVCSSYWGNQIFLFKNVGNSTYTVDTISSNIDGPHSLFVIDIDNDNLKDVISTSWRNDQVVWYKNMGAGNFSTENIIVDDFIQAFQAKASDIDGDNDYDVIAMSGDDKISLFKNIGLGSFTSEIIIEAKALQARDVVTCDIDNDGDQDVLSASSEDHKIVWYENLGQEKFSTQKLITNKEDGNIVHTRDLNNDGLQDILSISMFDHKLSWYENLGSGIFSNQIIIDSTTFLPELVISADLDNDSDFDIIASTQSRIYWYENLGNGNFSDTIIVTSYSNDIKSIFSLDLNGDGLNDILSASYGSDIIAWYENLGNGNFSTENIISSTADGAGYAIGVDIDNDGDHDVLSASWLDHKIAIYENLGNGNFSSGNIIATSAYGYPKLFAKDINNDNYSDIMFIDYFSDKIAYFENLGNGSFSSENIISLEADGATSVFAADINNDGDVDILSTSRLDNKVALYKNLQFAINSNTGIPCSTTFDTIYQTICEGDTLIFQNSIYIDSGSYIANQLISSSGCDSIIILNISINSIDTSLVVTDSSIAVNHLGANYKWLNCDSSYSIINGAISQVYSPYQNGTYAVEIENNGCFDTSRCVTLSPCNELEMIHISNQSICDTSLSILSILNHYDSYNWSTGSNSNTITINDTNIYHASLHMNNGCITYTDSVKINIFDCSNFIDTNVVIASDTCLIDTSTTVMNSYISNIITSNDSVYVTWNFLLNTGDTVFIEAGYLFLQNGVHSIGITINCNGVKSNGEIYYDLIEISHLTTSFIEGYNSSKYKIYPNPTSDIITISTISLPENMTINILSSEGKLVRTIQNINSSSININLEELDNALYIFEIKTKGYINSYYRVIKH